MTHEQWNLLRQFLAHNLLKCLNETMDAIESGQLSFDALRQLSPYLFTEATNAQSNTQLQRLNDKDERLTLSPQPRDDEKKTFNLSSQPRDDEKKTFNLSSQPRDDEKKTFNLSSQPRDDEKKTFNLSSQPRDDEVEQNNLSQCLDEDKEAWRTKIILPYDKVCRKDGSHQPKSAYLRLNLVLAYIEAHPGTKASEIAQVTGINRNSLSHILHTLRYHYKRIQLGDFGWGWYVVKAEP